MTVIEIQVLVTLLLFAELNTTEWGEIALQRSSKYSKFKNVLYFKQLNFFINTQSYRMLIASAFSERQNIEITKLVSHIIRKQHA